MRIQTLTQTDAGQAGWLKEHYASARKGNYDLYVEFVERGLQLLQPRGQLAFILPHKFFNAQYGDRSASCWPTEKTFVTSSISVTSKFFPRDQLRLAAVPRQGGAEHCRWVRADDLPAWLADGVATETAIPSNRVTDTEWNFAVGKGVGLFEKLQRMPVKLEDVTTRIFQGIKTSADKIYIVEEVGRTKKEVRVFSREREREYRLEPDRVKGNFASCSQGTLEQIITRTLRVGSCLATLG